MILSWIILAEGGSGVGGLITLDTIVRLINLLIFVGIMFYLLRRPLGESLRARREGIRRELMRAQEERNAALAKLEEVEARLAKLGAEVETINAQARREAEEERARIERSTEEDAQKLREQARREIESAGKAARMELREYAAEQSVRLAEEIVRRDLRPEDDERLMKNYVEDLGGIKH
ncbi:MAG TPA: ATP synthase F0 subunit B [Pyrinomonadaceae bacterium]|nr:ATP synthase F0 subunit B [Pyrinomonadaceae bacterium]